MSNFLSPILGPIGLDPSQGYDTAAAGAKTAQSQLQALSQLQWQRQMQGLQGALGYVNNLQGLYNSIYGPGGGKAAPGGGNAPGIPIGAMSTMAGPSGPPASGTTGAMSAIQRLGQGK